MATTTATRGSRSYPAQGFGLTASLVACWGHYNVTANPTAADVFEMCRTPDAGAGFLVLGGWFLASDMDTNATETLDMDLGWAANGTAAAETVTTPWGQTFTDSGYSASSAGFVNSGTLQGAAVTNIHAGGPYRPLLLPKPLWFAKPTVVQVTVVTASATFAAGNMQCCLIGQIL